MSASEQEQKLPANDDLQRNGLKTYDWGKAYWSVYQCLSYLLPAAGTHPLLLEFFFLSPRDLLPCVHCRRHFCDYTDSKQYRMRTFIQCGKLPEFWYLVHNAVNLRLKKPLVKFDQVMPQFATEPRLWERYFWYWLETIAFNLPADLQYPLAQNEHQAELRRRLKTYVLFFDLLKNVLPENSSLAHCWARSYIAQPPSVLTFTSRVHLLRWLFDIQKRCGYRTQRSFIDMLNELQPVRSTF